jgi:quercetin dioxygenase-like cupin family protein
VPGIPTKEGKPCTSPKATAWSRPAGQEIVELSPGDVIFAPDGEEHWHGARPDHFMTHLSITEGPPHWGPHVTDAEYQGQSDPNQ